MEFFSMGKEHFATTSRGKRNARLQEQCGRGEKAIKKKIKKAKNPKEKDPGSGTQGKDTRKNN